MSKKLVVCSVALAASVVFLETKANACGGLFCNAAQPVIQTGEGIVFAVDDEANTVDAVINIQYQGSAPDFAWVLPLQSAPASVDIAPAILFLTVDRLTGPRFSTQWTTRGECREKTQVFDGPPSGSVDAGASDTGSNGGGVQVLFQKAVGPYDSIVISGTDPEEMRTWLIDNGYNVTNEMMESVVPYVAQGDVLLALKLRNDRAVGDIQPIWVKMEGSEVCVPIRLTAIAATDDMDITTLVLSKRGRAIPENYNHLELNWARLNWATNGSNYRALVGEAADQGSGNAFVTEYAGRSDRFDDQLYTASRYDRGAIELATEADDLILALQNQGLTVHPEVAAILTASIGADRLQAAGVSPDQFSQCPGCWAFLLDGVEIDGPAIAAQVWARVIEPLAALQVMFDRYSYATRLFTLLSPEEMTVDPEFAFRDTLPDVSNVHSAIITRDCSGGGEIGDAPLEVLIQDTSQTVLLGPDGSPDPGLNGLPAASVVEQLALGLTIEDHRNEIDAALARLETIGRIGWPNGTIGSTSGNPEDGCDCRVSNAREPGLGLLLMLGLWVGVRRRRARRSVD